MIRRFSTGPTDSEIMRRATSLKLEIFRDSDGDLHGEIDLRCGIGMFSEAETFDADAQERAIGFARELLAEFTRRRPEGGATP